MARGVPQAPSYCGLDYTSPFVVYATSLHVQSNWYFSRYIFLNSFLGYIAERLELPSLANLFVQFALHASEEVTRPDLS